MTEKLSVLSPKCEETFNFFNFTVLKIMRSLKKYKKLKHWFNINREVKTFAMLSVTFQLSFSIKLSIRKH